MSRAIRLIGVVGAFALTAGMTVVSAGGAAGAAAPQRPVPLLGSAVPFTAHAKATADVAGATRLTIQVWLKPRLAAAERFATAVSTPGSPAFRHFLSPDGYTARFGPALSEVGKVESWLRAEGFTGVHSDPQDTYVRATAAASTIDAAFGVRLRLYQPSAEVNAGRFRLRANDRAVSVPAWLAASVLGVTGLDNAAPVLPLDRTAPRRGQPFAGRVAAASPVFPCSHYYGQHVITGLPRQFGTTSFPTAVCGYSAAQVRAAYGANFRNTGRGQTIALVVLGLAPDMFVTLRDYAAANRMPVPSPGRYEELSLGDNSCVSNFTEEEALDVEASYDMAPGANQLVVGGDSCNFGDFGMQGLIDAEVAILNGVGNHPLASVVSNSWEGFNEAQPATLTEIEHAFLVRAAAEGVGMYFATGDASGVETPSSDPFAVSVGGTTLGIGRNGNRLFETGWSTGWSEPPNNRWVLQGEQGASGGGPSLLWKQPGYQKHVVPPALATPPGNRGGTVRSVPDISADADYLTGFKMGLGQQRTFTQFSVGGTSLATPLVAGMVTAAQQGQHTPFGFLNPLIYKLARTTAIHDALPLTSHSPALFRGTVCSGAFNCAIELLGTFDDQNPNMFGYTGQVTLKGYDNMSGVGTPDGQAFITALRSLAK
jgi:subtilase family serine protease